ncbi:pesticidal protein Cry7Aa [Candidatus Parcubacteria bacterium]|nr:MAG: pesticidal protein Cry7Aa [Candidatus Parcubacteria bacterium]
MLRVKKEGVLLRPTNLPFENRAVFNPGALQEGKTVHLLYRALDKNHYSSLGYAELKGPLELKQRWDRPFMQGKLACEKMGLEDPRLVKIKNQILLTYTVHDGKNAQLTLSAGESLFNLKRLGIISPRLSYDHVGKLFSYSRLKDKYYSFLAYYKEFVHPRVKVWDKDGFFLPEKINSRFIFFHRILPDIQIARARRLKDLTDKNFWINNIKRLNRYVIMEPRYSWEIRHIGGGAPPIKTSAGWLMIYHGVETCNHRRIYHAGAALLDLKTLKLKARLPYPLFSPTTSWEKRGEVSNVVFPTGTAIFKDKLFVYYGAADKYVAVASLNLKQLLKELKKHSF